MVHKKVKDKIVEAGVFDAKYYEARYPDVTKAKSLGLKIDPLDH